MRSILGVIAVISAFAGTAAARPPLWAMPPGNGDAHQIRELFEQPQAWAQTRSRIDALGVADHSLGTFSDAELHAWLPQIRRWGIGLGLEVGAIKKWGPTGDRAFAVGHRTWDRFIAAGGAISAMAMDEPLEFSTRVLNHDAGYAVAETARFIALVRQAYPGTRIGDIEPYPDFDVSGLTTFIDALQARLRTMHVRGLDFFRLDVNWLSFGRRGVEGNWRGVHQMEAECHRRGLPFSLIYWAADYPLLHRQGLATAHTWEGSVMRQGEAYAESGPAPDEYVVQSWVGAPDHAVPETDPDSFMHSVLIFAQTFANQNQARH